MHISEKPFSIIAESYSPLNIKHRIRLLAKNSFVRSSLDVMISSGILGAK